MSWWQAALLGLVEGITEFLPVSSTGHLIIAAALLGLTGPEQKSSVDAFVIVIQGGAILAVLGLYWRRALAMLRGLAGQNPAGLRVLVNLVIAFVPAAALGLLLGDAIERRLFHPEPVIFALAVGGVYMIAIDLWHEGRLVRPGGGRPPRPSRAGDLEDMTPRDALAVGLLQCVALWPGASRAMMTITGGLLRGLKPTAAAEFSFLLGVPTLGAACLYRLWKNLGADPGERNLFDQLGPVAVTIGLVVAALSAALSVRWLVGYLGRRGLAAFGWYRILLAILLLGLVLGRHVVVRPDRPVDPPAAPVP
ncbi:MAG TPA: undecaprenyl-diphosphate phosphatase [Phycisphaerales bacterium]|nr:undecaprenyl-diphosphate phosphatase [Phycisphaerales bacterium]